MRKPLPYLLFAVLFAATARAVAAGDTERLDLDCVFLTRAKAYQFLTIDFDRRTVNRQPAMIGPDRIHWKMGDHGYVLERHTGKLTLFDARHNVTFELQCDTVAER